MDDMPMAVVLYAGSQRFRSVASDRETWHSFSFGPHYDPENLGFGPMTSLNDELLEAARGYPDHGHSDVEIVTWVVEGALRHSDSSGTTVLGPGSVLAQSAGTGIRHAEQADGVPTRFVQTWLRPDSPGNPASVAQVIAPETSTGLVEVVGRDALPVNVDGARLSIGTVQAGKGLVLPDASGHHLFVASGVMEVPDQVELSAVAGDALRITDDAGPLVATTDVLAMVWSF